MDPATVEVSKPAGVKRVLDIDVPERYERFVSPEGGGGFSTVESVGEIEKDELFDEHEEGEISDDSKPALEDLKSEVNLISVGPEVAETQDKEGPSSELLCDVSKAGGNVYSRRASRVNADGGQRGGWGWRSESATFSSSQPEHFYQIAWAKGIQGSPRDSVGGDSPQDASKESSLKAHKIDDIDPSAVHWTGNRNLEYLINRNGEWSVGEGAAEFGCFYRNSDGFLIWHEGAELRRGPSLDTKKARTATKSPPEKSIFLRSTVEKVDRQAIKPAAHEDSLSSTSQDSLPGIPNERQESSASTKNSRANRQRNNRGGGELEEGEIEGGGSLESILLTDASAIELTLERQTRCDVKGRDRHFGKPSERSSSGGWRHVSKPRDLHKDRFFSECAELLKNVSLKDAQKSFNGVCRQLHRALKLLRDYLKRSGAEGHRRRVSSLIRQAFSGIRAVYAARSSVLGKDEELGMDGFPRLLQLARFTCDKLFTSKQIQELESMIQTVGFPMRSDQNFSKMALPFLDGVDSKVSKYGDAEYVPFMTKLEIENTADTVESGKTSNLLDGAVHPAASHELVERLPTEGILADMAIATNTGFGGWFSLIPEQVDVQAQANSLDVGSYTCQTSNRLFDLRSQHSESRPTLVLVNEKSGRLAQEKSSSRNHVWPRHVDPVTAATSYHEKFAGKSHMVHTRLPSPTPSDEDEDEGARAVQSSACPVKTDCLYLTEKQSDANEAKLTGVMLSCLEAQPPAGTIFVSSMVGAAGASPSTVTYVQQEAAMVPAFTMKNEYERLTPSDLNLFPSGDYSSESERRHLQVIKGKSALMLAPKGSRKSRDPRKRPASESVDLNILQLDDVENEAIEKVQRTLEKQIVDQSGTSGPKQQHSLTSFQLPPNVVAHTDGLQMHMDSTIGSLTDAAIAQEQHLECLFESTRTKRPRIVLSSKDTEPEGLNTHISGISKDSQKYGGSGDMVSRQTTSSVRTAIVLRSKATDSSKPRMKPRDPRRVLLGSSSHEKFGDLDALTLKDDSTALTSKTGVTIASEQKNTSPLSEKAVNAGFDPQLVTEELARYVDMEANLCKMSPAGSSSSSSSVLSSSSSSLVSELSGTLVCSEMDRPEDSTGRVACKIVNQGNAAVKVFANTNGSAASKLDLNVSAIALMKQQQEGASHWDNLEHLLEGLDEQQKQAVREERARRIEEQSRMFSAKKLCLVLDLDHTLLNSAKFTEIEEEWETRLRLNEQTERNKLSKDGFGKRELYRFAHMGMWTKLRPGIWNFLARASQLYELHVYTMGNKAYASEMAKLLDPTGALFAGRVISKGDDADGVDGDEKPLKSKDLDGVLGMESAVVIIDDSVRVWPHHRHNLIVVERYMYFPSSRKQFGLPGPSLLEMGHDEREQDGMLASALLVIEKIHFSFFSNPRLHEVDVRDILALEQRRVLIGCKVIFSRVFPQGFLQPHLHPLWQLAEQFGAACTMAMDDEVTHVVAISLGTDKVNWAMTTGKFVVRPSWIEASAILYRRANERDFPVPP